MSEVSDEKAGVLCPQKDYLCLLLGRTVEVKELHKVNMYFPGGAVPSRNHLLQYCCNERPVIPTYIIYQEVNGSTSRHVQKKLKGVRMCVMTKISNERK